MRKELPPPREIKALIGGTWRQTAEGTALLTDKFSGEAVADVWQAGTTDVDEAVRLAREAFSRIKLSPQHRYEILLHAARELERRREEFIIAVVRESGLVRRDAASEVSRCIETLTVAAEEAKRITGECVPIDGAPGHESRMAFTIRVPVGVVCAITPFNAPLNTVAHKIAPALAAGNAVVLKPAELTPLCSAMLAELLIEAGLPPELLSVVNGPGESVGQKLLENPGLDFYAFTGSSSVGAHIVRTIGLRRSSLELGSISGTIICSDADLDRALPRILNSSFRKSGQVCTSVQRLLVDSDVADAVSDWLVQQASALLVGDPLDPLSDIGPMIDMREAMRVESWLAQDADVGARVLAGGERCGATLRPAVVTNVAPGMRIFRNEVFGPVVSIIPFNGIDQAINIVNDSPYGLAAGVFTSALDTAWRVARSVRVGTLHINDTSSARADLMPSGGVKRSGRGHEGPRYAMREMTEERLVTFNLG